MIRYTRVDGLNLSADSGLSSISVSEDGKRIGSIPGWNVLVTPSHTRNGEARNRPIANEYFPNRVPGNLLEIGEFPNGQPSFFRRNNAGIVPSRAINKKAWTVFSVVRLLSPIASGATEILRGDGSLPNSGFSPRLAFASGGQDFVLYDSASGTGTIARISTESLLDRTLLAMCTFSEIGGVNLYLDGQLGASNADARQPFESLDGPGEYWLLSGFNNSGREGQVGHTGILDIDLSRPESAGRRRALESYMFELYGITP